MASVLTVRVDLPGEVPPDLMTEAVAAVGMAVELRLGAGSGARVLALMSEADDCALLVAGERTFKRNRGNPRLRV
jgi:hypothetical protein